MYSLSNLGVYLFELGDPNHWIDASISLLPRGSLPGVGLPICLPDGAARIVPREHFRIHAGVVPACYSSCWFPIRQFCSSVPSSLVIQRVTSLTAITASGSFFTSSSFPPKQRPPPPASKKHPTVWTARCDGPHRGETQPPEVCAGHPPPLRLPSLGGGRHLCRGLPHPAGLE